ncbi:MAG: hypothetical protein WCJ71_04070 [Candidatus Omnitrophota bacterium]
MSKEQINYILVLATLVVVWLYFNTFYVNLAKNRGMGSFGGVRPAASALRLPNLPSVPKAPRPPQMNDLLKGYSQGNKAPAAPAEMVAATTESPKAGEATNS